MTINLWSAQDIRRAAKKLLNQGQQTRALELLLAARKLDQADGTGYTGVFPDENFKPGTLTQFNDGKFVFWVSVCNSSGLIFRVREGSTPQKRAAEKGFSEKFRIGFRHASRPEILWWLMEHPGYPMLGHD